MFDKKETSTKQIFSSFEIERKGVNVMFFRMIGLDLNVEGINVFFVSFTNVNKILLKFLL